MIARDNRGAHHHMMAAPPAFFFFFFHTQHPTLLDEIEGRTNKSGLILYSVIF